MDQGGGIVKRTHPETPRDQDRPVIETLEARAARIASLREAYLSGTLDLTVPVDAPGLDRLLHDLFPDPSPNGTRSRRRR